MRRYGAAVGRAGGRAAQDQVATETSAELHAMLIEWRVESVDDPYRTESDDDEGGAKGEKENGVKKAEPKLHEGQRNQGQAVASVKSVAEAKGGGKTELGKGKGDGRKGEERGTQGAVAREGVNDVSEGDMMVQVIKISVGVECQLLDLLHEYGLQVLPSPQT